MQSSMYFISYSFRALTVLGNEIWRISVAVTVIIIIIIIIIIRNEEIYVAFSHKNCKDT